MADEDDPSKPLLITPVKWGGGVARETELIKVWFDSDEGRPQPMSKPFSEEHWEQISNRWKFISSIFHEVDQAIVDRNTGQLWASLQGVAERTGGLAAEVLYGMEKRLEDELGRPRGSQTIIQALLGSEYKHLFNTSVFFNAAIRSFVEHLLPALVEGLALKAREQDAKIQAMEQILQGPGLGLTLTQEDIRKLLGGD